ncbi:SDR family NAD(P)-dependent oxidoreductase [Pseudomonas oryzihabitans]|uniref:SDR family NAD(P)-dependent oxidoreductase n=1 Tax=Pseudomonas oryzihabitans TaxID=47885 RepID=UPI0021B2BFD0|nr:SDR family NAD(P)-dependent oxidoreductase [Pseudomonas psychrotolerans]
MRTLPLLLAVPAALALLNRTARRRPGRPAREQLAGRTLVVTGASSGVGRGVALALAQRGANLVLAARRSEALEALAVEVQMAGSTWLDQQCRGSGGRALRGGATKGSFAPAGYQCERRGDR